MSESPTTATASELGMGDPYAPIEDAPADVQAVIEKVLKLEGEWFHTDRPRIQDEVTQIIRDEVPG